MTDARITMVTLSASPEGVLEAGRTYAVPEDVAPARAEQLVAAGYAHLAGGTITAHAPLVEDGPPALVVPHPAGPGGDGTPPAPGGGNDDQDGDGGDEVPSELEGMTVPQLRAYAAENDIDLGTSTRRSDILDAIRAAETGG